MHTRATTRVRFTQRQRIQYAARQKYHCKCCGRMLDADWDVDHVVPLAGGGSNDSSNIQVLCPGCHARKSRMQPEVMNMMMDKKQPNWSFCIECCTTYLSYFPRHRCPYRPHYHPSRMGPRDFPREAVVLSEPWVEPEGRLLDRLRAKMDKAPRTK